MGARHLEIRIVNKAMDAPLKDFFVELATGGDEIFFHPHPFTPEEAIKRANYDGKDLYYVLVSTGEILGYGMLRGWDEGYEIPSLGIAIRSSYRGKGLGILLMHFLHAAAKMRGASRIRLKVNAENSNAIRLYEKFGYKFIDEENGELIGLVDI
jgi:ribosomal protein S18 acetylase RimI-like enzyme